MTAEPDDKRIVPPPEAKKRVRCRPVMHSLTAELPAGSHGPEGAYVDTPSLLVVLGFRLGLRLLQRLLLLHRSPQRARRHHRVGFGGRPLLRKAKLDLVPQVRGPGRETAREVIEEALQQRRHLFSCNAPGVHDPLRCGGES